MKRPGRIRRAVFDLIGALCIFVIAGALLIP